MLICVPLDASAQAQKTDVHALGAAGNGTTDDTTPIQQAIDRQAATGGGEVVIPAGTYLCSSIHLRSNITLHLGPGATILGRPDIAAYDPPERLGFKNASDRETSFFHHALLWGEDLQHIAITGEGEINANFTRRLGPKPIALKRCRFVKIQGITIRNAPNYNISMIGTDFVEIDGVTILHALADGIDPDSCRNVRISNCHIEAGDDAIVLKSSFSLGYHRSSENITVTNCFLATSCNCFKIGTETGSDFKNIVVSNCIMSGLAGIAPASSGIAIETVDGANVEGVTISNISMSFVRAPIFARLGNRGRDMPQPVPGYLRNVSISHLVVADASMPCIIVGIPGHPIEDLAISDAHIQISGSGMTRESSWNTPENIREYPDPDMFGPLPADALFVHHVKRVSISDVSFRILEKFWRLTVPDDAHVQWKIPLPSNAVSSSPRRAIVCDDAEQLYLYRVTCWAGSTRNPSVLLFRVTHSSFDCSPSDPAAPLVLQVDGEACQDNTITNSMGHTHTTFVNGAHPSQALFSH